MSVLLRRVCGPRPRYNAAYAASMVPYRLANNDERSYGPWASVIGATIALSCSVARGTTFCRAETVENEKAKRGAEKHWAGFLAGAAGDFHGKFCRWDPFTGKVLAEMHLQRQYTEKDEGGEKFVQQKNWMYFPDGRVLEMGPWDIKKEQSNDKGIRHPRAKVDGFTFIVADSANRPTAWIGHRVSNANAPEKPGTLSTGIKGGGYEQQGHMFEFIMEGDVPGVKFSVGYAYDNDGKLQHVTWNREDSRGYPSAYWDYGAEMQKLSADDLLLDIGSTKRPERGQGHQLVIRPEITEQPITDVEWMDHLTSLKQKNVQVRGLPEGMVLVFPTELPFGNPFSIAFIWQPKESDAVHSMELRYHASGDFDCCRHVKFQRSSSK